MLKERRKWKDRIQVVVYDVKFKGQISRAQRSAIVIPHYKLNYQIAASSPKAP